MKIDMDRVPRLIEHWLGIAERSKGAYEHWMQKADCEPNPGRRAAFEAMANSEMTLANAMRGDADHLLQQFVAAGGSSDRIRKPGDGRDA